MYSNNFKNVKPSALPGEQIGRVKVINICGFEDAVYPDGDPDWDTKCTDVQAWCAEHGVTYYGQPKTNFALRVATRQANIDGNDFALVEDLS
jgi:hypothetical protein